MTIKSLIPRMTGRKEVAVKRREGDPVVRLQREMNQLFDDFFGPGLMPFANDEFGRWPDLGEEFIPRVDMEETDDVVRVSAELPGMDEKDVKVEMDERSLTLSGERKSDTESKEGGWHRREQFYGSFSRLIPMPADVVIDKAKASMKKGMLTIELPKKEASKPNRKLIHVHAET